MATRIKDIINGYLQKESQKIRDINLIIEKLSAVLSPEELTDIAINKKKNRLYLETSSSTIAYQLNLQKRQIEEVIKRNFSEIKAVVIKTRKGFYASSRTKISK